MTKKKDEGAEPEVRVDGSGRELFPWETDPTAGVPEDATAVQLPVVAAPEPAGETVLLDESGEAPQVISGVAVVEAEPAK